MILQFKTALVQIKKEKMMLLRRNLRMTEVRTGKNGEESGRCLMGTVAMMAAVRTVRRVTTLPKVAKRTD